MHVFNERVKISQLKSKYDYLIGWGTTGSFRNYYHPEDYRLDYLVDGLNQNVGTVINEIEVLPLSALNDWKDKNVCFVIFPAHEKEIWNQIAEYLDADVVFHSLLLFDSNISIPFSKNAEDMLMLNLLRKLNLSSAEYLDVGVCHPLLRNNTYLLYCAGYRGVLVEPNPIMHPLIELYRPEDKLLKHGVSDQDAKLNYYSFYDIPGCNGFFDQDPELEGHHVESVTEIPVYDINKVIQNNFKTYPNLIDLDVEGMEALVLNHIDFNQYPIDIICCERGEQKDEISAIMMREGFQLYASTVENDIYVNRKHSIHFV